MKKDTSKSFAVKAQKIHGDKYSYHNVEYINSRTKVAVTCKKHGDFLITPSAHIQGRGCPKCKFEKQSFTTEDFIRKSQEVHGDFYDYSKSNYVNSYTQVKILCPEHGEFFQTAKSHIYDKKGCKYCGIQSSAEKHKLPQEVFEDKANFVHSKFYEYGLYSGAKNSILVKCPLHGTFSVNASAHLQGQGCPECHSSVSNYHQKLIDDLSGKVKFLVNDKKTLDGKYELDLFFPEHNFAVEINGVYWHSSIFKPRYYHQNKFLLADKKGIKLLQVWDSELRDNYDLVLSMIKVQVGLADQKIPARKTTVKHVDPVKYKDFLNKNHIQGEAPSKTKLGLFYKDQLVSVIGFTLRDGEWVLDRFCSDRGIIVVGGFSKLFKYFVENFGPEKIVTFSDNRYSNGALYKNMGFDFIKENVPRLYYTDKNNVFNRRNFQKPRLKKAYPSLYNDSLTEKEIAEKAGFYQLWGPGTRKWVLLFSTSL